MNKYNFFIPGRLPGMNEIISEARHHYHASAKQKKKYTSLVADVIRLMFRNCNPMRRVWITCRWVEKNKMRDPDNIVAAKKYICDGLIMAGLLLDDDWNYITGFTDTWEVGEPGVWVTVQEC